MFQNILLELAYDGQGFQGFQEQPGKRTVAGCLRQAVEQWNGRPTRLIAAGRTDRGVHARSQWVNFLTPHDTRPEAIAYLLRPYLPEDLLVRSSRAVPANFQIRFHAQEKTYVYDLVETQALAPAYRKLVAASSYSLDAEAMRAACGLFVGRHDFSDFARQEPGQTGERTIFDCALAVDPWFGGAGRHFHFTVRGDAFLREQVRFMIGALIELGRGKRSRAEILASLRGEPGRKPYQAAPACGLTLAEVQWTLPEENHF